MSITFEVAGIPAGQGSLRANRQGHLYETTKNHRPWRDALIHAARQAWQQQPVWLGPVEVQAVFSFPRPKSHYGTGRNTTQLKAAAPDAHSQAPDLDHLQRSLGDAIQQAGCIRNDGQIACWRACKFYSEQPGVIVTLTQLENG